jgi:hypothetical protein
MKKVKELLEAVKVSNEGAANKKTLDVIEALITEIEKKKK